MTKNIYKISNNAYETNKKQCIIDAWKISLKYSKILIDHRYKAFLKMKNFFI